MDPYREKQWQHPNKRKFILGGIRKMKTEEAIIFCSFPFFSMQQ